MDVQAYSRSQLVRSEPNPKDSPPMHEPFPPPRRGQPEWPNGTLAALHKSKTLPNPSSDSDWARELGNDPDANRLADLWRVTRPNDPDDDAWAHTWSVIEARAAAHAKARRLKPLWLLPTALRPHGRQSWAVASVLLAASLLTALGLGWLRPIGSGPSGPGSNSTQSQPHAPAMLTISLEVGQLGLLDLSGATPTVHTLDTDRLLLAAWGQLDPDADPVDLINEFKNNPAERDLAMGLVVAEFQIFNHMESIADSEGSW